MAAFNGLGLHLGNLSRLSDAKTRSISAENVTGEKGKGGMATDGLGANAARDLGRGWKISPAIKIEAGQEREIANIDYYTMREYETLRNAPFAVVKQAGDRTVWWVSPNRRRGG